MVVLIRFAAALFLLLAVAPSSPAQETGASRTALRVGVDEDYPPLAYRRDDGVMEGFDIDVAYALCAELDRACVMVPGAFGGMIEWIRGGRVDLAVVSMSITDARARLVDFTIPYYTAPIRYVGGAGQGPSLENGMPEGQVIGVRNGTVFERYADAVLDSTNTVISYPLQEEIYLDLLLERLDLVLGNELTLRSGFLETQLGAGFSVRGPRLEDPDHFGRGEAVTLRKGQPQLKDDLNQAIRRLQADGGLEEIWSRYFDIPLSG